MCPRVDLVAVWVWLAFLPSSRNPGQSSSSHYVALPNHHGYHWIVRLAWSVVLDSVKTTIAGSGPRCLPRGLGFHGLSDNALRVMIGGIGLGFGLQWWIQHLGLNHRSEPSLPSAWHTRFWSMVAGFTSFSVHAGGPPLQVALLPQRLDPKIYAATTVVFFTFVNLMKVYPYYWLDQFTSEVLWTAMVLAPVGPVAVRLGIYLNQRISALWFYRVCYFALIISSGRLLIIGLTT